MHKVSEKVFLAEILADSKHQFFFQSKSEYFLSRSIDKISNLHIYILVL